MSRYDIDQFDPAPDPELQCGICRSVLDAPRETPCRHVYCRLCIDTWLARRRSCPACRSETLPGSLREVVPLVQNLINNLRMKCTFWEAGCPERVTLEGLDGHVARCGYVWITCDFRRCEESMFRRELAAHQETCAWQERLCTESCGLMVLVKEADQHDCLTALLARVKEQEALLRQLQESDREQQAQRERLERQLETMGVQLRRMQDRFWRLGYEDDDFSVDSNSDSEDYYFHPEDNEAGIPAGRGADGRHAATVDPAVPGAAATTATTQEVAGPETAASNAARRDVGFGTNPQSSRLGAGPEASLELQSGAGGTAPWVGGVIRTELSTAIRGFHDAMGRLRTMMRTFSQQIDDPHGVFASPSLPLVVASPQTPVVDPQSATPRPDMVADPDPLRLNAAGNTPQSDTDAHSPWPSLLRTERGRGRGAARLGADQNCPDSTVTLNTPEGAADRTDESDEHRAERDRSRDGYWGGLGGANDTATWWSAFRTWRLAHGRSGVGESPTRHGRGRPHGWYSPPWDCPRPVLPGLPPPHIGNPHRWTAGGGGSPSTASRRGRRSSRSRSTEDDYWGRWSPSSRRSGPIERSPAGWSDSSPDSPRWRRRTYASRRSSRPEGYAAGDRSPYDSWGSGSGSYDSCIYRGESGYSDGYGSHSAYSDLRRRGSPDSRSGRSGSRDTVGRRSGSRDSHEGRSGSRDTVGRRSGSRDTVGRRSGSRDTVGRRSGSRDTVGRRSESRDTVGRRSGSRDTVRRRSGSRDSHDGCSGSRDTVGRRSRSRDTVGRRSGSRDSHEGGSGSRDSHEGRCGSRDSHEGRSGSRDSHEGRCRSRDSHEGRSGSRDTDASRSGSRDSHEGRSGSRVSDRRRGGSRDLHGSADRSDNWIDYVVNQVCESSPRSDGGSCDSPSKHSKSTNSRHDRGESRGLHVTPTRAPHQSPHDISSASGGPDGSRSGGRRDDGWPGSGVRCVGEEEGPAGTSAAPGQSRPGGGGAAGAKRPQDFPTDNQAPGGKRRRRGSGSSESLRVASGSQGGSARQEAGGRAKLGRRCWKSGREEQSVEFTASDVGSDEWLVLVGGVASQESGVPAPALSPHPRDDPQSQGPDPVGVRLTNTTPNQPSDERGDVDEDDVMYEPRYHHDESDDDVSSVDDADEDADYKVRVPKTTMQRLAEYDSGDSDSSWAP